MNYGFIKVAAAVPSVKVADCKYNVAQIENLVVVAESKGVHIIVFPELSITAYTCGDLFQQQLLLENAEIALMQLLNNTRKLDIISIVGMPLFVGSATLNVAVIIQHGSILGIIPKTYLPNYKEFYEKRWFCSANDFKETSFRLCGQTVPLSNHLVIDTPEASFSVEICEDLWAPIPPSSYLTMQGADIIFNLSADNDVIGKHKYLCSLIAQQSARCLAGYVFSSCGFGESTTDVVFGGNGLIYENGVLLNRSERFNLKEQLIISEIDVERIRAERRINNTFVANQACLQCQDATHVETSFSDAREVPLTRCFEPYPFVPKGDKLKEHCEEIFSIQVAGLAKRILHTHSKTVIVGISGGLDSTLALLVCTKTFDKLHMDKKNIISVTMPGFGTTDRTYTNAVNLIHSLGTTLREIDIQAACRQHFADIGHREEAYDVTYENSQARERTQILMDIANQESGMVIGTGDLSELALGWATYNGDHISMYGVNCSIPKTLVRHLIEWVATNVDAKSKATLLDIIETPISPELIPANNNGTIKQKTEDIVGPYELHDFFLYYFIRFGFRPAKILFMAERTFAETYDEATIRKWLHTFIHRFFTQQFKRSCLPDGPKVGSISLSPRGDWRMPSDAVGEEWENDCNCKIS